MASSALTAWTDYLEQLSPTLSNLVRNISTIIDSGKVLATSERTSLLEKSASLLTDYSALSYTTVAATALGLLYLLFSMSSYTGRGSSPFGGRRSLYGQAGAAQIKESDFEYVTPDQHSPEAGRPGLRYAGEQARSTMGDDPDAPDVILVRHLNQNYPLRFKAYAISDGAVTVGDIRYYAAEILGNVDPRRLKLFYKGKQLRDDKIQGKAEGLKQHSEILIVISEVSPDSGSSTEDDRSAASSDPTKKRRKRRGKPKPSDRDGAGPAPSPPRNMAPPDPNTPAGKVNNLSQIYITQWRALCLQYLSHPPTDAKARDFEHKRLTESILAQIILKADEIEMQGDEQARQERKSLLAEVQEMLRKLDAVVGKRS